MSDAPPVPHALNCACNACCAARAAEARRRIEEVRRAHAIAAREEEAGRGQVFKPLKKPARGSLRALVKHSRPRLTKAQAAQVRSLVEDSGYTRAEAVTLVRLGAA